MQTSSYIFRITLNSSLNEKVWLSADTYRLYTTFLLWRPPRQWFSLMLCNSNFPRYKTLSKKLGNKYHLSSSSSITFYFHYRKALPGILVAMRIPLQTDYLFQNSCQWWVDIDTHGKGFVPISWCDWFVTPVDRFIIVTKTKYFHQQSYEGEWSG